MKNLIGKHQKELEKASGKEKVVLVYLFGSEARGTSHKESDVDVGILFDKKVDPEVYLGSEGRLIDFFSGIFLKKEINIVNLNISSPLLKQVAILEGNLLYARSETDRILFQIKTLREYEDYLHLNNIYNQFLDLKLKSL